jgi:hypothetical protein
MEKVKFLDTKQALNVVLFKIHHGASQQGMHNTV